MFRKAVGVGVYKAVSGRLKARSKGMRVGAAFLAAICSAAAVSATPRLISHYQSLHDPATGQAELEQAV